MVHLASGIRAGLAEGAKDTTTTQARKKCRSYAIKMFEEEFDTSWKSTARSLGKFVVLRGAPRASADDLPSDTLGFYIGLLTAKNGGDWRAALLDVLSRTMPVSNQDIVDQFIENVGTNKIQGSGLGVAVMRHGSWEWTYPKSEAPEIVRAAKQVGVMLRLPVSPTDQAQILNAGLRWLPASAPKVIIEDGKETLYEVPPGYIFSK